MKITKYILTFGLLLTASACTQSTIMPQIGDMTAVIANASTEAEAVKIANFRARQICDVHNQAVKVIDLETIYQGPDKNQKSLIELAQSVLPKDKTSGPYVRNNYTYKTTLTFRCV